MPAPMSEATSVFALTLSNVGDPTWSEVSSHLIVAPSKKIKYAVLKVIVGKVLDFFIKPAQIICQTYAQNGNYFDFKLGVQGHT